MAPRVAGRRSRPERPPATAASGSAPPHAPAPAGAVPASSAAAEPDLLVCGRIGKPQGLRGEVTVEVRTDVPEERFAVGSVLLTEPAERGPLTVAATRDHAGRLVVVFEGVPDRTAAEALRDTLLLVDAATLPLPEDPDVFLDGQLVGLRAELPDGTLLGHVGEVLHLPHGDVLAVRRDGAAEALVPFVAAIVPTVDVPGGRLVVDPPPGLLEDLPEPAEADAPAPPDDQGR